MLLAAVHLEPAYTVPPALLLVCIIVWYWRRIGQTAGHDSRRRIRRCSLVIMLMTIPAMVLGLSYFNTPPPPTMGYVTSWCIALLLLLGILLTAVIDMLNNFRLGEIDKREQIVQRHVEEARRKQREQANGEPSATTERTE